MSVAVLSTQVLLSDFMREPAQCNHIPSNCNRQRFY